MIYIYPDKSQRTVSFSININTIKPGIYNVQVIISNIYGDIMNDPISNPSYYVNFYGNSFTISNPGFGVPSPKFLIAIFTNDGSGVLVYFDSPTNFAGLEMNFECTKLLFFPGNKFAKCQWQANNIIAITPRGTTRLNVGDSIALSMSSPPIQAICGSTSCEAMENSTISVLVSENPIVPSAVLSLPSLIGNSGNFIIDFSSSTGNGGRPWDLQQSSIEVKCHDVGLSLKLTKNITTTLRANANGMPITIPSSWFIISAEYQIYLTLVNFLGVSGSSYKSIVKIDSNIPVVSIIGPSTIDVLAKDQLSVRASIKATSISSLAISWNLLLDGLQLSQFTSISKDRSLYKLDAYSLQAGQKYVLQVIVTNTTSFFQSTNEVTINVLSSDLVSVINGPDKRSSYVGDPLLIDASGSYDPDSSVTNLEKYRFSWTCMKVLPQPGPFSGDCTTTLPFLKLPPDFLTEGLVLKISAGFSDPLTNRFATSTVTVEMTKASDVLFTIQKSSSSKLNVNSELSLSVLASMSSRCNMLWSTDDLNADKLQLISTTPTNISVGSVAQKSSLTFLVPLVIASGALVEGTTYNFRLACYRNAKVNANIGITVMTNEAPVPGRFSVQPLRGTALQDVFTFSNNEWVDPDLPLTYTFYYISPSGSLLTIRGKNEISYASSILPSGGNNDSLLCVTYIYDSLIASSAANFSVYVQKASVSISGYIKNIDLGDSDPGTVTTMVSIFSSVLNQVTCNVNCSALFRVSCTTVANTCGTCLSSYDGIPGIGNTACRQKKDNSIVKRGLYSTCVSNYDCQVTEQCISNNCEPLVKSCLDNCSGHGTCVFRNDDSNKPVESCYVSDKTCTAVCTCNDGFKGPSCVDSTDDFNKILQSRELLIKYILENFELQDISEFIIQDLTNILSSLTAIPSQISPNGRLYTMKLLYSILNSARKLSISFKNLISISDIIDSFLESYDMASFQDPGALLNFNQSVMSDATKILLTNVATLISSDLVYGESNIIISKDTFRMIVSSFDINRGIDIVEPVMDSSPLATVRPPQTINIFPIATNSVSNNTVVTLNAVYMDAKYFTNSTILNSNPLRFELLSPSRWNITMNVTMQNLFPVDLNKYHPPEFVTYCYNRRPKEHRYPCPAGFPDIIVYCNGTAGNITTKCPSYYHQSLCHALQVNTNTVTNTNIENINNQTTCVSVTTTDTSTTCNCQHVKSNGHRRLQSQGLSKLAFDMITTTDFKFTYYGQDWVQDKYPNATPTVLYTVVLIGGVVSSFLFFFFIVFWEDSYKIDIAETINKIYKINIVNRNKVDWESEDKANIKNLENLNKVDDINLSKAVGSGEATLKNVFQNSLPNIFRSKKSLPFRLLNELITHHPVLNILISYDNHNSRMIRLLISMTKSNVGLASIAFLIWFGYSSRKNNDFCYQFNSDAECTAPRSTYDVSLSKCYWDPFYNSCYIYVPSLRSTSYYSGLSFQIKPSRSTTLVESSHPHIYSVIILACVASLLATPFQVVTDWIGSSLLWVKTTDRLKFLKDMKSSLINTKGRVGRTFFAASKVRPVKDESPRNLIQLSLGVELRRLFIFIQNYGDFLDNEMREALFSSVFSAPNKVAVNATVKRRIATRLAQNKVSPTRSPNNLRNSIRASNEKTWSNINAGNNDYQTGEMPESPKTNLKSENSMNFSKNILRNVKNFIRKAESEEKQAVDKTEMWHKLRLLYLFQYDLLPPLSKRVLESKYVRDNPRKYKIPEVLKVIIMIALLGLNFGIIISILMWSYQNNNDKNIETNNCNDIQRLLIESFIVWMVLEPLVFSLLNVIFIHMLIPLSIITDIYHIRRILSKTILKYRSSERKRNKEDAKRNMLTTITRANTDLINMNDDEMTKIFFYSKQLADRYPSYNESKIILSYSSDVFINEKEALTNRLADLKNIMHYIGIVQDDSSSSNIEEPSKWGQVVQKIYFLVYRILLIVFDQNILVQNIGGQVTSIVIGMILVLLHVSLFHKGSVAVLIPSVLLLAVILMIRFIYHKKKIQQKVEDWDDETDDEHVLDRLPFEDDEDIGRTVTDISDDTDTKKHLKMLNISKTSSNVNKINIREYDFEIDEHDISEEKHNDFLEVIERKNKLDESVHLQKSARDADLRTHKGMRQMFMSALSDSDAGRNGFKDKVRIIRNQPRKFNNISNVNSKFTDNDVTSKEQKINTEVDLESSMDFNVDLSSHDDIDVESIDNSTWLELLKE